MNISPTATRIIVFAILFTALLFSNPSDYERSAWTEIQLNYPISKKIESSLAQQIRYDINMSTIKWHVTDIDLSARFNKNVKISTKYRFKDRFDAKQHGLYGNFYYQTKKQPINIIYRLRYNKKLRYGKTDTAIIKKRDEEHIRNRIIIEYDTKKFFVPYTGVEIFYLVNNDKYKNGFDIFRYYLGFEMNVFKKQKIDISWVFEEVFNFGTLSKENILKVQYSFDIK